MENKFDIIVVGGGHAGIEASLASARMGLKTLLISLNFNNVANMPCNPSIGGSAKGIVVREIDALGGEMAKSADDRYMQMKMLNRGKGPGVWALRSQNDRALYRKIMQDKIMKQENLTYLDGAVTELIYDEHKVLGVILNDGRKFYSNATILALGTYANAEILVGLHRHEGGPDGEKTVKEISHCLKEMGLEIIRLKTGTPPRIKKESIDFSRAKIELGTDEPLAFSYETNTFIPIDEQYPCYLIYTTKKTHDIINEHLNETALYSGNVKGIGPRYCPSIEAKVVQFPSHERHQLFLEPEGHDLHSIYLQGFATSMCEKVQVDMVHSLPGLEKAEILKYAYAIEYDALSPLELKKTLETKKYDGLYIAGQIAGTSGYEEAAGLGLMAGINAALKIKNEEPFILGRDESYIGVMIDDLVTKGISEPYRLLSSRAEYRLLLRHDNADTRLTEYGYKLGLISEKRYATFKEEENKINKAYTILTKLHFGPKDIWLNEYLISLNYEPLTHGVNALELIRRKDVSLEKIVENNEELKALNMLPFSIVKLEVKIKYEGYIKKQEHDAIKLKKLESVILPQDLDYKNIDGLALEAREKLAKVRPISLAQASRISGINPSDINRLLIFLKKVGNH